MRVYILELRQRTGKDSNKTVARGGTFSRTNSAQRWVKKHGRRFAKDHGVKNGFFACMSSVVDTGSEDECIVNWWNFEGNSTYIFSPGC
jgi:hypothetical protein